jgi:fucose permease
VFFGACGGLFVYGVVLALLGTVFGLAEMRERLPLDLAHQGHLFLLLYSAVLVTTFLSGPVSDSVGYKWVLLVSALLIALGFATFTAAHSFRGAIIPAMLLGLGGGGLCIASNGVVSELFPEARSAMLNLLGFFFGVGAFALPMLVLGLSGRCTPPQLLLGAAGLSVIFALWYAVCEFPKARERHGFSMMQTVRVSRYPGLPALAILLFFEAGNEASMGGWTSVYAGAAGQSPRQATTILSCYWAGLMLGRLLAPLILRRLERLPTILAGALGSVLGCGLLLNAHSFAGLATAAALTGFSLGPVFQTALGIAGDRYTQAAGSVIALLFVFALAGSMVLPWGIGQISGALVGIGHAPVAGVRAGLLLPLGGAATVCVLAILQMRAQKASSAAD